VTVPFNKERDINVKKKFKTTNQNTHRQHFIGVEPHDTTTHLLPAHSYQFKKKQVNTKFANDTITAKIIINEQNPKWRYLIAELIFGEHFQNISINFQFYYYIEFQLFNLIANRILE